MADSNSQLETSEGTVKVNTYVSGCNIDHINQHNHLRTPSTRAPRRNPIDIERTVNTFTGRVKELNDIMQRFHDYPVVVIAAMGGMGKTQLARKFASVNADVYRDRYWINAETEEQLLNSFDRLAKKVKVEANTDIDTVRDTYRSFNEGAALLIFDNVENVNNVYDYLPTRIQLADITLHVLVTSRWTAWTSDSLVNCYQLQPFDVSVSLQLFQRIFGKTCIESMQDKWQELARTLGYLPLALQVATSYICKRTKHNSDLPKILADYMKQLRKGAEKLLNDRLTEYDNRSISTSMLLTLKQLENKTGDKWKLAVTLINASAYMYPDIIEKKRLLTLLDNDDNTLILDEALIILTEYSLFIQGDDWRGDQCYTVHRIIQTSIRYNQTVEGTADKYYTEALKYALVKNYFYRDVLKYANKRVTAIINYYKENPSPTLLRYLVECSATTAVKGIFDRKPTNHVQALIKKENWLYRAVENEDLSMAQLLLCYYGAKVNQLGCKKREPLLHFALRRRNMAIVTWMLKNGAAPTVRDRKGRNALHVAIMHSNHKMVSIIIKTDRDVVNKTDNFDKTPLLNIDYSHNEEDILLIIRALADGGADFTAVNQWGDTVLHLAARGACAAAASLIRQLKQHLINIVNKSGETALHVIPYNNTLIDDERILSTIRALVEFGVSVDLTKMNILGNTVLHYAACGACAAAVSLILQLNKHLINTVNKNGQTALHVIPYNNTLIDERILSTIRVFHENGEGLRKVDIRGDTVLHLAARGTCVAAVSLILDLNEDLLDIENEKGETPLHVIGHDFNDIINYLSKEERKQIFARNDEIARLLIMRDIKEHWMLDTVESEFNLVTDECDNEKRAEKLCEHCAIL